MRYLLAALGGAAIGAGAALLLAPQSGRATRATIRDKATKCTGDVQDFAKGKTEHLRNKLHGVKSEIQGAMHKGRNLIGQTSERITETTSNAMDEDSIYASSTV